MSRHRYPVLIETAKGRRPAGFSASAAAERTEITFKIRERGWIPYKVRFDSADGVWIVAVIDWQRAA
jgi:hypothetical protein